MLPVPAAGRPRGAFNAGRMAVRSPALEGLSWRFWWSGLVCLAVFTIAPPWPLFLAGACRWGLLYDGAPLLCLPRIWVLHFGLPWSLNPWHPHALWISTSTHLTAGIFLHTIPSIFSSFLLYFPYLSFSLPIFISPFSFASVFSLHSHILYTPDICFFTHMLHMLHSHLYTFVICVLYMLLILYSLLPAFLGITAPLIFWLLPHHHPLISPP